MYSYLLLLEKLLFSDAANISTLLPIWIITSWNSFSCLPALIFL